MRYPVNWIAIVRGFNLNKNSKKYHRGVDFGWYSTPHKYQPIYAVADGEVIYKEVQKNSGGLVIHIKHKGYVSEYGHLDTWNVKLGQKVKRGEKIGTMGASGNCTAMHLHFGLCKGEKITYTSKDKWLNPLDYLCKFNNQTLKNLKTKLLVKHSSKKATTDLWVHNKKNYNKASRVYIIKKNEETAYYGKDGKYAIVDNLNNYYCSKKYLK